MVDSRFTNEKLSKLNKILIKDFPEISFEVSYFMGQKCIETDVEMVGWQFNSLKNITIQLADVFNMICIDVNNIDEINDVIKKTNLIVIDNPETVNTNQIDVYNLRKALKKVMSKLDKLYAKNKDYENIELKKEIEKVLK